MGDRWYTQQQEGRRKGRRLSDTTTSRDFKQPEKFRQKVAKSSIVPDWSQRRRGQGASRVSRPVLRIRFINK